MNIHDNRGVLYPQRLPSFERRPAPPELSQLVRWFWIPHWELAPGETSRQEVLPFPAANLVVEPSRMILSGPTTRVSVRELRGSGWAVGALLRPAGLGILHCSPADLVNTYTRIDAPDLQRGITESMPSQVDVAIVAYAQWLAERGEPSEAGLLANRLEEVVATDHNIVRIGDIADRLCMSVRSVQRLSKRFVGLPPMAIIRRYRLQEAAQRLRENPDLTVSEVASDLGYADHAHLNADFRAVLGTSPRTYRSDT